MSGVYIKDIRMPDGCGSCRFCGFGGVKCELDVCMFTGHHKLRVSPGRMDDCPLVPVPEHGDLMDRDAFRYEMDKHYPFDKATQSRHGIEDVLKSAILQMLFDAPTIIPASRGIYKAEEGE